MLTPIEIQGKSFKSGLGYDKKDVDSFIREVLSNYEALYKENVELTDKITVLNDGIQYYKTIEKTLQKALVLAEKTAEETKDAALEKAKSIEKDAHVQANSIIADAKNELNHIHSQTIQLVQQYEKYKVQFKKLAEMQLEILESESFKLGIANLDVILTQEVDPFYKEAESEQDTLVVSKEEEPPLNTTQDVGDLDSLNTTQDSSDFEYINLDS